MNTADKIKELALACFDLRWTLAEVYGKDDADAMFNKMMSALPNEVSAELMAQALSGSLGSRKVTITGLQRSGMDVNAVKMFRTATNCSLREAVDIMHMLQSGTSVNITLHESHNTAQAMADMRTSLRNHFKIAE